jgi:small-conductance mechanosensitive channel
VEFKFDKEAQEMQTYLNDVEEKLEALTSSSLNIPNWTKSTCEDFTNQFNIFKHNFQVLSNANKQIECLYDTVTKLPAYKMRKASLKHPYDQTELLTDYYLVEVVTKIIKFLSICMTTGFIKIIK